VGLGYYGIQGHLHDIWDLAQWLPVGQGHVVIWDAVGDHNSNASGGTLVDSNLVQNALEVVGIGLELSTAIFPRVNAVLVVVAKRKENINGEKRYVCMRFAAFHS
jgi:hypothetical protein